MGDDNHIVNIENLDPASVLCALFNNAQCSGGLHQRDYNPSRILLRETAHQHLSHSQGSIEVLLGRNIFIDFTNTGIINVQKYNTKNNRSPSAQQVIAALKDTAQPVLPQQAASEQTSHRLAP